MKNWYKIALEKKDKHLDTAKGISEYLNDNKTRGDSSGQSITCIDGSKAVWKDQMWVAQAVKEGPTTKLEPDTGLDEYGKPKLRNPFVMQD